MAGGKANLEISWAVLGDGGGLCGQGGMEAPNFKCNLLLCLLGHRGAREIEGGGPQKVSSRTYLWPFGLFLPLMFCTAGETRDPRVPVTALTLLSVLL